MGIRIEAGRDVETGDVFEGTKIIVEDLEDASLAMGDVAGRDAIVDKILSDNELHGEEIAEAVDAVAYLAEEADPETPDKDLIEDAIDTLKDLAPYALKALSASLPWLAKLL